MIEIGNSRIFVEPELVHSILFLFIIIKSEKFLLVGVYSSKKNNNLIKFFYL